MTDLIQRVVYQLACPVCSTILTYSWSETHPAVGLPCSRIVTCPVCKTAQPHMEPNTGEAEVVLDDESGEADVEIPESAGQEVAVVVE